MKPLAITGLGVVSPLGIGRTPFLETLGRGREAAKIAFRQPTVLDKNKVGDARAAEVWGFDAKAHLGDKGLRNFDRLTTLLIVAAKHALEDAGLKKDGNHLGYGPDRVGICSSTAYGSLDAITELNIVAELEDPRYINPSKFPNTVINAAAGYVSIWEDLRAPNITVVDGNCGGLDVVLTAATHLANHRGDAFVVGGGEVLSDALYLAMRVLGIVAEGDSPEGIRLGEGAAYLILERTADAQKRDARIEGYVRGYGTAFIPPESPAVLVHACAESVELAVLDALRDAGLGPKDIDVVCGAASGLRRFDEAELTGLRRVLGDEVAIGAPKLLFGETFGAGGALGMAAALGWLDGVPVEALIAGKRPTRVKNIVVTTVGYYGNVSAVVLSSEA